MAELKAKLSEYFKLEERGSTWAAEIRGGLTTFLTMAYILPTNAGILANSGGECDCPESNPSCMFDSDPTTDYNICVEETRLQLITTTALASFFACVFMGAYANLPFGLAPGLGLNAYFTFDVVGFKGTGSVAWETALTAIFIEGIIFLILTVTGIRKRLMLLIPRSIKAAMSGGIGLFLAIIGLTTSEGISLVANDVATGLTLGGCPAEQRSPPHYCPIPLDEYDDLSGVIVNDIFFAGSGNGTSAVCTSDVASTYTCDDLGGQMTNIATWLGLIMIVVVAVLQVRNVPGAVLFGIVFVTGISWFRGTSFSFFEDDVLPGGEARFEYFKQVVKVEPLDRLFAKFDFSDLGSKDLWIAVITFLYVDILDTSGTLFAMAKFAGMMDETGDFEGSDQAFLVDSVATCFGALLGTSTVTTFIESGSGIKEGARTGLAAITTGFCFLLSIFFAPIIASIPPWAIGGALVIVGSTMMQPLTEIDWSQPQIAIPAFFTVILMPFTYSIANGIIAGIGFYIGINGLLYVLDLVFPMNKEEIEEKTEEVKEEIQTLDAKIEDEGHKDKEQSV